MLAPDKESPLGEAGCATVPSGVQVNYGSPESPTAKAISELPAPPYPDKVGNKPNKAGGYVFELDIERMHQSDTWVIADARQRPLLLMLWVASWTQVPCGTLPADDALIAARIGLPLPEFKASKDVLMRGWWKASNGRLYHPVITEQVIGVMERKAKGAARQKEWRERHAGGKPDGDGEVTRYSTATDDAVMGNSTVSNSPTTTTTATTTEEQERKHLPGAEAPSFPQRAHADHVSVDSKPTAYPQIAIPLKDGSEYIVTGAQIAEWIPIYPDKDVIVELKKMKQWCIAHPAKRKSQRGVVAFITGWLARPAQANAPPGRLTAQAAHTGFDQIDYQKDADEWNTKN